MREREDDDVDNRKWTHKHRLAFVRCNAGTLTIDNHELRGWATEIVEAMAQPALYSSENCTVHSRAIYKKPRGGFYIVEPRFMVQNSLKSLINC